MPRQATKELTRTSKPSTSAFNPSPPATSNSFVKTALYSTDTMTRRHRYTPETDDPTTTWARLEPEHTLIGRCTASRRAQIQLFESIAVLLVFFVIVGFAITFYFFISKTGASREHARAVELSAITTAQKVSTLPELDCVQVGVHVEKCFDELKVDSFSALVGGNKDAFEPYHDTLGYSKLVITKVYPSTGTILLYDNKPRENISIEKTFLPINTYNPITKIYGFALLEVSFYED